MHNLPLADRMPAMLADVNSGEQHSDSCTVLYGEGILLFKALDRFAGYVRELAGEVERLTVERDAIARLGIVRISDIGDSEFRVWLPYRQKPYPEATDCFNGHYYFASEAHALAAVRLAAGLDTQKETS